MLLCCNHKYSLIMSQHQSTRSELLWQHAGAQQEVAGDIIDYMILSQPRCLSKFWGFIKQCQI